MTTTRERIAMVVAQCKDLGRAVNFNSATLPGADFSELLLEFANFQGANLEGVNFQGANLEGANFEGVNLQGASLYGANLEGASFQGANLEGVNFQGANFEGVNLQGAVLDGDTLGPWIFRVAGACENGQRRFFDGLTTDEDIEWVSDRTGYLAENVHEAVQALWIYAEQVMEAW